MSLSKTHLGAIAFLVLVPLFTAVAMEVDDWVPLAHAGVQQCNTKCQTELTDCVIKCDGAAACIEECKKKAQGCVQQCTGDAGSDATGGG